MHESDFMEMIDTFHQSMRQKVDHKVGSAEDLVAKILPPASARVTTKHAFVAWDQPSPPTRGSPSHGEAFSGKRPH